MKDQKHLQLEFAYQNNPAKSVIILDLFQICKQRYKLISETKKKGNHNQTYPQRSEKKLCVLTPIDNNFLKCSPL